MCCKDCGAKFRAGVIPLKSVELCQEMNCHLDFFGVHVEKPEAFKILSVNIFATKNVAGSKAWIDSNSNTSFRNPYFVDEEYKVHQEPLYLGIRRTIPLFICKFIWSVTTGNVRGSWVWAHMCKPHDTVPCTLF